MQNRGWIREFQSILKSHQILTDKIAKSPYLKGFRVGKGEAVAVLIPDTLLEFWHILEQCAKPRL